MTNNDNDHNCLIRSTITHHKFVFLLFPTPISRYFSIPLRLLTAVSINTAHGSNDVSISVAHLRLNVTLQFFSA